MLLFLHLQLQLLPRVLLHSVELSGIEFFSSSSKRVNARFRFTDFVRRKRKPHTAGVVLKQNFQEAHWLCIPCNWSRAAARSSAHKHDHEHRYKLCRRRRRRRPDDRIQSSFGILTSAHATSPLLPGFGPLSSLSLLPRQPSKIYRTLFSTTTFLLVCVCVFSFN